MKALHLSAASIALACALSAKADEVEVAAAAAETAAAPNGLTEQRSESTVLSQAKAVIAAVRQRFIANGDQEVLVIDMGERVASSQPAANCERMEIPGSRIRETRCYNPSPGELALNQYQFQEEMRQIRDQAAMRVMQESQYDRVVLEAPQQPPTGR